MKPLSSTKTIAAIEKPENVLRNGLKLPLSQTFAIVATDPITEYCGLNSYFPSKTTMHRLLAASRLSVTVAEAEVQCIATCSLHMVPLEAQVDRHLCLGDQKEEPLLSVEQTRTAVTTKRLEPIKALVGLSA
jgi:hypothetical protein